MTRLRTGQLRKCDEILGRVRDLSLPIQAGSGTLHTSYAMDTGVLSLQGEAAKS